MTMPSLFLAHGAPLLAIESNAYTQALRQLAEELPRPKAILIFSAHWESAVQAVGTTEYQSTIHDFGGFPQELYEIQYPAKGDPGLAAETIRLMADAGISAKAEPVRGLDHGAWVVLRLMYPKADIPVVSLSVNPLLPPAKQYEIGKALQPLRDRDILIIGSGGTVHNFSYINMRSNTGAGDAWAVQFEEWLKEKIEAWDTESVFSYETLAPHARQAVPAHGQEHFVPLLYAMGAADEARVAARTHISFRYGSLSHVIWQFGKN
ncbi:dioxygenase [Brevibacillus ruminantium]|uniref:Dioxygenase n=1 Tax=Brevibacillus ruminantium TaxID=2950604 RepID=A0ABY4WC47_9BACL|nr:class III extradiol ring-cleavage dioxygenase [Brevibacillus ruminantium]USG64752.1 dioxygenase [Brevibacillus ruminantium]